MASSSLYSNRNRRLDVDCSRFFCSQIVLFLSYMHKENIVYRDLKPENMLVDKDGYLKIIDFGLSKKIYSKTYTVCGTPHYIAPEILLGQGYDTSADVYSFGVVLYEMIVGTTPFVADSQAELFTKIVNSKVKYPSNIDHKVKRLLKKMLEKDPSKRITIDAIKSNSFFAQVNFAKILDKTCEPPFFPSVKSDEDTSNFKKVGTPMLNSENCPRIAKEDDIFLDW